MTRCSLSPRSGIYPTNTTLSDYIELIELFGTMQQYRERANALVADNLGFPYKNRLGYNAYGERVRASRGLGLWAPVLFCGAPRSICLIFQLCNSQFLSK